jgi:hypothetical protein
METPSMNGIPTSQNGMFPIYSYKHYEPSPTVVYTQHEEEVNDLIAGLKAGYVSFQIKHNFSSCYIRYILKKKCCVLFLSPIAFDMEWHFYFVDRGGGFGHAPASRTRSVERRTAVVQVMDSTGLILVIQIYNMTRMFVLLSSLY